MTYSIVNTERENRGSQDAVFGTVDITSLDSAGYEPITPGSDFGLEDADEIGVSVRGQENTQYKITYDHINGRLAVQEFTDTGDGTGGLTDVASGTDVGEVILEVVGV